MVTLIVYLKKSQKLGTLQNHLISTSFLGSRQWTDSVLTSTASFKYIVLGLRVTLPESSTSETPTSPNVLQCFLLRVLP